MIRQFTLCLMICADGFLHDLMRGMISDGCISEFMVLSTASPEQWDSSEALFSGCAVYQSFPLRLQLCFQKLRFPTAFQSSEFLLPVGGSFSGSATEWRLKCFPRRCLCRMMKMTCAYLRSFSVRCALPGEQLAFYLKTLSGAKHDTCCVASALYNGITPSSAASVTL